MNTITILAFVALVTTGLAVIHAACLRRAARNALCCLIQHLRRAGKAIDYAWDCR